MNLGFFIRGVPFTLPHPPVQERTILLICKVIQEAWELLKSDPPAGFVLSLADEDTITQCLVEIIENRLRQSGEVLGFNKTMFGRVIREPKVATYNKKSLDKMPDILFDLRREDSPIMSEHDGLFVECKPVDVAHPVGSCYCKNGLVRFVIGDYAWAMQDAVMVGYVSAGYGFDKLAAALQASQLLGTVDHFEIPMHSLYRSQHKRDFKWLEPHGSASGISVSHLWLLI